MTYSVSDTLTHTRVSLQKYTQYILNLTQSKWNDSEDQSARTRVELHGAENEHVHRKRIGRGKNSAVS